MGKFREMLLNPPHPSLVPLGWNDDLRQITAKHIMDIFCLGYSQPRVFEVGIVESSVLLGIGTKQ